MRSVTDYLKSSQYKKHGVTTLDNSPRADINQYRKVDVPQLTAALNDILPTLSFNKSGLIPKSVIYRLLMTPHGSLPTPSSSIAITRPT